MTWREIEKVIKHERYQVKAEISRSRNKYWILVGKVHYEISALQFDKLLEGGYIDPDYRRENSGQWSGEALVYEGR